MGILKIMSEFYSVNFLPNWSGESSAKMEFFRKGLERSGEKAYYRWVNLFKTPQMTGGSFTTKTRVFVVHGIPTIFILVFSTLISYNQVEPCLIITINDSCTCGFP